MCVYGGLQAAERNPDAAAGAGFMRKYMQKSHRNTLKKPNDTDNNENKRTNMSEYYENEAAEGREMCLKRKDRKAPENTWN